MTLHQVIDSIGDVPGLGTALVAAWGLGVVVFVVVVIYWAINRRKRRGRFY